MSEEEIIKILKDTISLFNDDTYCISHSNTERWKAIQGLLDLYQAEKEKCKRCEMYQNNSTLMEELEELRNKNAELRDELEVKNVELNEEKEKNKELKEENEFFKKLLNWYYERCLKSEEKQKEDFDNLCNALEEEGFHIISKGEF